PALAQLSISESLIAREALAISMVFSPTPWQNWRRPPLEPPEPTTGAGNCANALPNSSATMLANGSTVEEPAICTLSRAEAEVATPMVMAAAVATQRALSLKVMVQLPWLR